VNAIVIYESLTGNTRLTAEAIAAELRLSDVDTTVSKITEVNMQALSEADLVVVGSWTDGLILFGHRPGRVGRLKNMPAIDGKKAAVFCSYAINAGQTLDKMSAIVEGHGGEMLGGMAIKRTNIGEGAAEFVARLLGALDKNAA